MGDEEYFSLGRHHSCTESALLSARMLVSDGAGTKNGTTVATTTEYVTTFTV